MNRLPDGTVQQDGLIYKPRKSNPMDMGMIYFPVKGSVLKVYYIDDSDNQEGSTYVCDVFVPKFGMQLFKVPFLLDKADYDNYVHYAPLPATRNLDMTPFSERYIDPKKHNGTIVLVQFIDGLVSQPVITKVLPHVKSGRKGSLVVPIGFSPDPRPANKDDGDCYKVRYNGTNFMIDKDGHVTIKQTKMTDDFAGTSRPNHKKIINFELQDPITGGLQMLSFNMDNSGTGEFSISAKNTLGKEQSVSFDAAGMKTTIKSENAAGTAEIDLGPTGVKAKTATGSTLNLSATGVGLGTSTAELLDLFDQLLAQMNTLLTAMSTETHIGNLGYSTSPPVNASSYLAVQAQISLIKGLLTTIKGGI